MLFLPFQDRDDSNIRNMNAFKELHRKRRGTGHVGQRKRSARLSMLWKGLRAIVAQFLIGSTCEQNFSD